VNSELLNLSLFVAAIAKVLLMTGVGVGGAIALVAECCGFKVVALGFEKQNSSRLRRGDAGENIPGPCPPSVETWPDSPRANRLRVGTHPIGTQFGDELCSEKVRTA